ncbi:signal transduction histidine kinase [Microbacterium natoriense]|uniref:histidine kinase n=1 Tax=Microbacterium natoriense TaxID=284570 RepID=A0AAW8ESL9_9MICO|nr:histidine kinase [Microbacterium natoriense]MDQ0646496.1 signal transduction histidine kinase [Microbacterium natoriense]
MRSRMLSWLRDWRFVAVEAAASVVSVVLFCVGLTLLPLMLITGGVLLMPEVVKALRSWSDSARLRIGRRRGEVITGTPAALSPGSSIDERLRFAFSRSAGRDALWLTVHALPVLFVSLTVVSIPLGVVSSLAVPFYWYLVPADDPLRVPYPVTSWALAATMPLIAAAYALVSWWLIPATARLLSGLSARLLTAPEVSRLAARVDALTLSRAAALDAHGAELRRIERDLHDGAQNRLVNVVMMLGIAERALETGAGDVSAPLQRAQEAAAEALAGLRRTVHDIYPPILDELGLEGALASLAGRSIVPCTLEATDIGRVPAAVESASYFVVAEALTNISKHSRATRAVVRVTREGDRLRIAVEDDGVGGAIERPGGGFAGIRRRLEAFEGAMSLDSPVGGPTSLRTELPCGS